MWKAIWPLSISGLILLVFPLSGCGSDPNTPAANASRPFENLSQSIGAGNQGISVGGQGEVQGTPDLAIISMSVSVTAPTVQEANAGAQDAMNKLLQSIKANGIADKDIQTQYLSIYPEYYGAPSPLRDRPEISGYRATNTVLVKVRNLDSTGEVIDDAAGAAGDALQIQGITLTIDNPSPLRKQAREKAVEDAKAKAEELARLAGVNLGPPIAISESSGGVVPPFFEKGVPSVPAAGGGAPIAPGELDVVVTVQITYAIQ